MISAATWFETRGIAALLTMRVFDMRGAAALVATRVSDLVLRSIAKRCVSKDEATALHSMGTAWRR
jgi:hypothetical protein